MKKKKRKLIPRYADGKKILRTAAPIALGAAALGGATYGIGQHLGVRFGGGLTNIPANSPPPSLDGDTHWAALDAMHTAATGTRPFVTVPKGFYLAEGSPLGPKKYDIDSRVQWHKNKLAYEAAKNDPNIPRSGLTLMENMPMADLSKNDLRNLAQRTAADPRFNNLEATIRLPEIELSSANSTRVPETQKNGEPFEKIRKGDRVPLVGTKGTSSLPLTFHKNTALPFNPDMYPKNRMEYDNAMREAYGDDYVPKQENRNNRLYPGSYAETHPDTVGDQHWYDQQLAAANRRPTQVVDSFERPGEYDEYHTAIRARENDPAFMRYRGPEGAHFQRNPQFNPHIPEDQQTERQYIKGEFDDFNPVYGPHTYHDDTMYDQQTQLRNLDRLGGRNPNSASRISRDSWRHAIEAQRTIDSVNQTRDELNTTAQI